MSGRLAEAAARACSACSTKLNAHGIVNKRPISCARKGKDLNFHQSEPEFLISCLDRHTDWAVIVCLVGGGQEINTGEAGIGEWIESLDTIFFTLEDIHIAALTDSEYGAASVLVEAGHSLTISHKEELHLAVSMRSFRAEDVSLLVKQLLDLNSSMHKPHWLGGCSKYPIVLTRDLSKAKRWLKQQARARSIMGLWSHLKPNG